MLLAASIGEDVLRALLQGTPPGTVYALIALGFVLTYKTSGVFNLAFGAQAYVSAAMFFHARQEWGWSILPALVLSVFVLAPAIGLVLERAHLQPPPHGVVGGEAGRRHRPLRRAPGALRRDRRLRGRGRADPHRDRRRRCIRLLRPLRRLRLQPRRADGHRRGGRRDGGARSALPVHGARAADASRRREPSDGGAERDLRRPCVRVQLGAVERLRRHGRRAHRPTLQHPRGARLLQPGRGRHRRRGHRAPGEPAARPRRRPRARDLHRLLQHLPATLDRRPPLAAALRGEPHPVGAVRGAVRGARALAGDPPRRARPTTRWRASIRRRRRWPRPSAAPGSPGPPGSSRSCSSPSPGSSSSRWRTSRGSSSSRRP